MVEVPIMSEEESAARRWLTGKICECIVAHVLEASGYKVYWHGVEYTNPELIGVFRVELAREKYLQYFDTLSLEEQLEHWKSVQWRGEPTMSLDEVAREVTAPDLSVVDQASQSELLVEVKGTLSSRTLRNDRIQQTRHYWPEAIIVHVLLSDFSLLARPIKQLPAKPETLDVAAYFRPLHESFPLVQDKHLRASKDALKAIARSIMP